MSGAAIFAASPPARINVERCRCKKPTRFSNQLWPRGARDTRGAFLGGCYLRWVGMNEWCVVDHISPATEWLNLHRGHTTQCPQFPPSTCPASRGAFSLAVARWPARFTLAPCTNPITRPFANVAAMAFLSQFSELRRLIGVSCNNKTGVLSLENSHPLGSHHCLFRASCSAYVHQ